MATAKPQSTTRAEYLAAARDAAGPVKERVSAIRRAASQLVDDHAAFQAILDVLLDAAEPVEVREAALQSLQAASFRAAAFEPLRGPYTAALRSLVDEPDPELRQRVLGLLAREKDAPTQQRLIEGLEDPTKELVPPEKALQLLSYDVHAGAYPVARKLVKKPPSEAAKLEALRLLSADAATSSTFERLLMDKSEPLAVRQLCASALQAVRPKKFQDYARELAMDNDEDNDLRAQSLAALTHLGDAAALAKDAPLLKKVAKLKAAAPAAVKRAAAQFLTKYGD